MPIRFQCEACLTRYTVDETHAGKQSRCAKCQAVVRVPPRTKVDAHAREKEQFLAGASKEERMRALLDAFDGMAPRVASTWGYRFVLGLVAGCMVLLPVLYLALIGLLAFALLHHATRHLFLLRFGIWIGGLFYAGPLFAGCVALIVMVRPFFARPSARSRERFLEIGKEPLLFAFVGRIAQCVHAPQPRRISLDLNVNAGVRYESTLGALFGGDLVLNIGLPLVRGLTTDQFAGVLAHELGHLAQNHGMRFSYLIDRINTWFAQAVYKRDHLDDALERQIGEGGFGALIGLVARLCVGLVRCILWLYLMLGHAISCFFVRHMERDADRQQIHAAGSAVFEATFRRILCLNMAQQLAVQSLGEFMHTDKLPNDFAELVVAHADALPAKFRRQFEKECMREKTGFFDSHPAMGERIAQARAMDEPGLFHLDAPASMLFEKLEKHARAMSKAMYREILGARLEHLQMVETITSMIHAEDR